MTNKNTCYCGSELNFDACCNRFLSGKEIPTTAEQLMRSRFCAFKTQKYRYLIDTFLSKAGKETLTIDDFDSSINWLGLRIVAKERGESTDDIDYVEFVAFFEPSNNQLNTFEQLHERSYFEKHNGRWYYVSGQHLPDIKLGRNETCFCGSGKKFKKCHG